MRQIQTKNADNIPPILAAVSTIQEQETIALTRDLDAISASIYKGEKIIINDVNDPYNGEEEFEVRYILRTLFYNKCAYCEKGEYKPDVEHFRPKKAVTGAQRNRHGYYWLCYEWTNLLPSCASCNRGNAKWAKFPIKKQRIIHPPISNNRLDFEQCKLISDYLLAEQPLLLNPEIDEPTDYFKLEWNGKFSPLDGSNGRGRASIDTYDLNRGNLIRARKEVIDDFKKVIYLFYSAFRKETLGLTLFLKLLKFYLEDFKTKQAPETLYSFVYVYICTHFEEFAIHHFSSFSEEERQLLLQTFEDVV